MPWICPNCGRQFKNTNQDHSCAITPMEYHLIHKNPNVVELYHDLSAYIMSLGNEIRMVSVKNAILFATMSSFIALKPKKEWLEIEFNLERKMDIFPIHKILQITKSKHCHFMRIDSKEHIDQNLLDWLLESYQVSLL